MSRLVGGQFAADPTDDGGQVLLLQRPADAVPVESDAVVAEDLRQPARGLPAQVLVLGTLHDAEQRLGWLAGVCERQPAVFANASHGPLMGALHRLLLVAAGVDQRGQ